MHAIYLLAHDNDDEFDDEFDEDDTRQETKVAKVMYVMKSFTRSKTLSWCKNKKKYN